MLSLPVIKEELRAAFSESEFPEFKASQEVELDYNEYYYRPRHFTAPLKTFLSEAQIEEIRKTAQKSIDTANEKLKTAKDLKLKDRDDMFRLTSVPAKYWTVDFSVSLYKNAAGQVVFRRWGCITIGDSINVDPKDGTGSILFMTEETLFSQEDSNEHFSAVLAQSRKDIDYFIEHLYQVVIKKVDINDYADWEYLTVDELPLRDTYDAVRQFSSYSTAIEEKLSW